MSLMDLSRSQGVAEITAHDAGVLALEQGVVVGAVGARAGELGAQLSQQGCDQAEIRPLDSFGFGSVSLLKIDVKGFEDEVLAGVERLIRESRPVILIEILGGRSYPGAPTLGHAPPASVEELGAIHATWRTLEAFGYSVHPVLDYDYIALPPPRPGA